MRIELDFLKRADIANMHRRRALQLRALVDERSVSATHDELIAEAKWREAEAQRLDDATEPQQVSDKAPIRIDERAHPADYIEAENGK